MKIGLLWFDKDPRTTLIEKITRAAHHHRKKYGIAPDACYVHKSCLSGNGQTAQVGHIRVAASPTVLLHHLWIGQEDQP